MVPLFGLVARRIEHATFPGELSIVGVIHHLRVEAFPHTVANIAVAARFEINSDEYGRSVTANVALVDESGHRNHLDQRQRILPGVTGGRPSVWDFALNLSRVTFDGPGRFQFVLRLDNEIVSEIPMWVVGPLAPLQS